jgi:sortase A
VRRLLTALAVGLLIVVPTAPAAARAEPSVTVSPASALLGATVRTTLTGWPAGVVTAALCGNEARQGSADCAVAAGASTQVPASGQATVDLRLAAPPSGCPCVVRVSTATGDRTATAAIAVADVPDSAVVALPGATAAGGTRIVTATARLDTRWTLAGLLGGPAQRVLRVELDNAGTTPVRGLDMVVDLGRAAGDRALPPVPLGDVAVNQHRVVEVPVTIAGPAVGRYTVSGRIDGADAGVEVVAHTSVWPWLLPPVLLMVWILWFVARRALHRRRAARAGRPAAPRASPVRLAGIALVTAGVLSGAVLAGQTLLPARETAAGQAALDEQVREQWAQAPPPPQEGTVQTDLDTPVAEPAAGQPFAVMHVPRWGTRVTVVQGVSTADLRKGPGHYPGTAVPGQIGNVAVAGHRGPAGAPFNDIDKLVDGDPIVVETATSWYVYRVARHVVVAPDRVDVVAEVPERPGVRATSAMLTLTACHPRFSSRQRYVVFAELGETLSKMDGRRPAELG